MTESLDDVPRAFSHASRGRLTHYDLGRFTGDTLFDRIARAVCEAGCLPRRELYEAWEVARRVRRRFRGGRVVDLAAGHGLLAHVMLLLDDTSAHALAVDTNLPPSAMKLRDALEAAWPRLSGRVELIDSSLNQVALTTTDVVVASHACGSLTDAILTRAAVARTRLAVLPCCHHLTPHARSGIAGWVDGPLAIDIERAHRLEQQGYRVWTQTIPPGITAKARLLLAEPSAR